MTEAILMDLRFVCAFDSRPGILEESLMSSCDLLGDIGYSHKHGGLNRRHICRAHVFGNSRLAASYHRQQYGSWKLQRYAARQLHTHSCRSLHLCRALVRAETSAVFSFPAIQTCAQISNSDAQCRTRSCKLHYQSERRPSSS